jgi:8-oxo-dGTP diphosphatase
MPPAADGMLREIMDDHRVQTGSTGPASVPEQRLRVAAAVVWHEGRLLLTQRPPGGPLGLQWELPGGKIERAETPEEALERELREELGVGSRVVEVIEVGSYDYPHGLSLELVFARCTLDSLDFAPSPAVNAVRWVAPAEIDLGQVLAADREFLKRLGAGA